MVLRLQSALKLQIDYKVVIGHCESLVLVIFFYI